MEKGKYKCVLCENEFEPTKRGLQRFCTSKCRKKYHYHLTKKVGLFPAQLKATEIVVAEKKNKIEEMSMAGVGNAAIGSFAAIAATELAKNIFAAPKPKLNDEVNNNQRLLPVLNLAKRPDGSRPFFDVKQQILIYIPDPNYKNPADHVV